jgi:uncharacterized glyoxalase superfamily protein PhnB
VSVFPALRYRDAPGAVDWLERVLGFETTERIDNPDGTIAHAELRLGDGLVMLGSAPGDLPDVPDDPRASRFSLYVAVVEIDALHARAKGAGADVSDLFEQDYGSRDFNARDPEGNHWSFGTYTPPHAAAARPDSA